MSPEKFKALRSRPFYGIEETPFTSIKRYEQDASNAIARWALLSGDMIILKELERSGRVYYWLPDEKYPGTKMINGIAHRFDGIRIEENKAKRVFTRLGDGEEVSLGKRAIKKIIIQQKLSNKQIIEYGYLYGVPDRKDIS